MAREHQVVLRTTFSVSTCQRRPLPVSQLELLKMGQTGELKQLWDAASVTNVRINLVRLCTSRPETQRTGTYVAA